MYLYQRKNHGELFEKPYPHFILWDAFPQEFAQNLLDTYGSWSESWTRVREQILSRREEITQFLHNIFDQPFCETEFRDIEFCDHGNKKIQLVRDWHTDGSSKKYHMIYYVGTGPGGWHQMTNKQGNVKTLPYTHNMLLCWHNTPQAIHRFWSSPKSRKSLAGALYYK